jgi:FAD binding domain/Berberine and berberine like
VTSHAADTAIELTRSVRCPVLVPGVPGFDQARKIWNGMFDEARPAAIVQCRDADDCAAAMRALAGTGVEIAVRGGGHHVAGFGTSDGGVVIDLGAMRGVTVDEERRRARVQGGATLHDIDTATSAVGQAVPLGVVSETGVGGLALSGGIGWLSRLYGYTCDNLVSAEVVTVEGERVTASETENPDLLWGLRGGGGNFGIVTEFEFRTHPVDVVHVAEAWHAVGTPDEAAALLAFFRDWTEELPDYTTVWATFETASVEQHGDLAGDPRRPVAFGMLACAATPDADAAREVVAPMLRERTPARAQLLPMRMVELQHLQDTSGAATSGMHVYMKGETVTHLTDRAVDGIADHVMRFPTPHCLFEVGMLGGELGRRDEAAAAVGMRAGRLLPGFSMMARDASGLEENIAWARSGWETLRDGSAGGVYLNFDGSDADADRVLGSMAAGADADKRARLVELKRRWDPNNVLRRNHNIDPSCV